MLEVTGLLVAAALRPADVLGDHGRAAGRSHSLHSLPRPHFRASGAVHSPWYGRSTCAAKRSICPVRRTASGLIRRGGRRDGAGT